MLTARRGTVAVTALLFCGHQVCEAAVPLVVGVIIDEAIGPRDGSSLIVGLVVLAVLFTVLSNSYRFGARIGEGAELAAGHDIRMKLTGRILDPRGGAERERLTGDLAFVAGDDATSVGSLVSLIPYSLAAAAGGLAGAAFLLQRSLLLGSVALVGVLVLIAGVEFFGRPLARRAETERDSAGAAGAVAANLIAGLRPLKGIGGERAAEARYDEASERARSASVRSARATSAYEGGISFFTGLLLVFIAFIGGRMAAGGDLSLGELIAALGLTQYMIGPLSEFGWIGSEWSEVRASSRRVAAVLGAPRAIPEASGKPDPRGPGGLELRDVTGGTLESIDLSARPGEMLGVAFSEPGRAAALIGLLARERDPDRGTIELDGRSLGELDPEATRRVLLVAEHEAAIFAGTVREIVGGGGADDARIESALEAASAREIVDGLPGGLDAPVAERGHSLSGGQRQRLSLTRALCADAPVLVLHDPTTAVDAASEAEIAGRLREFRTGRTTIVVTTSPALLDACDRVLFVDGEGDPAAGTHRALVAAEDRYRETVLA